MGRRCHAAGRSAGRQPDMVVPIEHVLAAGYAGSASIGGIQFDLVERSRAHIDVGELVRLDTVDPGAHDAVAAGRARTLLKIKFQQVPISRHEVAAAPCVGKEITRPRNGTPVDVLV